MNYKLVELLDIPTLRDLLDSLDEINSMPSAIIDTEGNILTATAWHVVGGTYENAAELREYK